MKYGALIAYACVLVPALVYAMEPVPTPVDKRGKGWRLYFYEVAGLSYKYDQGKLDVTLTDVKMCNNGWLEAKKIVVHVPAGQAALVKNYIYFKTRELIINDKEYEPQQRSKSCNIL